MHKVAETLSLPVRYLGDLLTKDELNSWLSYYTYKEPDTQEIQMAILIASVRNALGGKTVAKDFIFSGKESKEENGDEFIQLGKFKRIKKSDLKNYLKPMKR